MIWLRGVVDRMAVMPERVVADRYLLEHTIGRGGIGTVWLAHDRLLDREVAVKEVSFPETLSQHQRDDLRARALREARAAARLDHPGAITIYDVLEEQGHAFIVMELITAPTLAELVARGGPLPPERVARIGLRIASALEAAHRAGIVHRDVKPANVMVGEDGSVWLGDFGIAQLQGDPKLTASGIIVGSPWYMAPEQASGGQIGPETDLWGLGATMYYAVEGEAPFERAGSLATLAAVVNEPPRPPRHAGALTPVLMSLLAKDPAARPGLRQVRIRLARVAAAGREDGADRATVPVAPPDLFTPAPTGELPAEGAAHDTIEAPEAPTPASRAWRDEGTGKRRSLTAVAVLGWPASAPPGPRWCRAGACGDRAVAWQRRGRRARGRADPRDQRANDQPSGADRSTDDRLEGRRVADHLPATSGRGPRGARGLDQLHQPERRLCGRLPLRLKAQHRSGPARHVVQRGHRTLHQGGVRASPAGPGRSEEHTSELQSRPHLVCRLLLEKKKKNIFFSFVLIKKKNKKT